MKKCYPVLISLLVFGSFGSGTAFAQYTVETLATNGPAGIFDGRGLAVDHAGNVYATGTTGTDTSGAWSAILEVSAVNTSSIVQVAGVNGPGYGFVTCGKVFSPTGAEIDNPSGVAVDNGGNFYFSEGGGSPAAVRVSAGEMSGAPSAQNCNSSGSGVAVDGSGNVFFSTSSPPYGESTGGPGVYKVTPAGVGSTVVGGGTKSCAAGELGQPLGLAMDASGNLYIADEYCNVIWKVPASGGVIPYAGTPGNGNAGCADGTLYGPTDVAVDESGNLFIADRCGIRMVTPSGSWATIANNLSPLSVAVGPGGNIYVGLPGEILMLVPAGAGIYSPSPGSLLPGTSVTFSWSGGPAGAQYELDVSDKIGSIGQGDIFTGTTAATSQAVPNIPCDGRQIYVQLSTNGETARRYDYTACPTLSFTASPFTLPFWGGTVALSAHVENLSPAPETVDVGIWQNFPPQCHPVCLGLRCYTLCTPIPSELIGSTTLTLAPSAPQTFTVDWSAGWSTGSRSFNFSAVVTTIAGAQLDDSASVTVNQN